MDGEQERERTSLHQSTSSLGGRHRQHAQGAECKAEDVFAYAQVHGGDQVDSMMTRCSRWRSTGTFARYA